MSAQFKPWLVLTAIFLAGIATGCALTMVLLPHFHHPPSEKDMQGHMMSFLTHRLHLTDDQRTKIEPIVSDTVQKIQMLHRNETEHGAEIFRAANEKMAVILTPEQNDELKKLESEREKMLSGHMGPWGPRREGPGSLRPFGDHGGPGDRPPPPTEGPKDDSLNGPPAP